MIHQKKELSNLQLTREKSNASQDKNFNNSANYAMHNFTNGNLNFKNQQMKLTPNISTVNMKHSNSMPNVKKDIYSKNIVKGNK